jgi:methyl-accepting chemotaxis protein
MGSNSHRTSDWRQRLRRMSIVNRLLIGNSMVIIASAVIGILLSGHLTTFDEAGVGPIVLSLCFGVLLGTVANYWVIKTALRPLQDLREMVKRVQAESTDEQMRLPEDANPDIRQLAATVNAMLDRLDTRTGSSRDLRTAHQCQEDERKRIAPPTTIPANLVCADREPGTNGA